MPVPAWSRVGAAAAVDWICCAFSLLRGGVALYVTLTTLAEGRFGDNAFLLTPHMGEVTVPFVPVGAAGADVALLTSSLRVEHLAMYL